MSEYLKQHRRWYLGIGRWLPHSPVKIQLIKWPRMAV